MTLKSRILATKLKAREPIHNIILINNKEERGVMTIA